MNRSRLTKVAAATGAVVAVALGGLAAKELSTSTAESSNPRVTIFCSEFVPQMEASSVYAKWASQNHGERDKWVAYRTTICLDQQPVVPVMATAFGKALVAAGKMALTIDVPPPTTTTTTTQPTTTTTTTQPTTTTTTTTTTTPPPPPPGLSIISPAENSTVSGQVTIKAQDSDPNVDWVGFYPCDGGQAYEDQVPASGVWEVVWDSTTCANGVRNMAVFSFSSSGAILRQIDNYLLNVSNGAPPPPPPPPPSDCDPTADPGPIAGLNYSVKFKDCFSTLDRTVWCSHQWWEPNPVAGAQSVTNGELRLRRARVDGYANTTMSSEPCGQANPKSFTLGYMEARMKWETAQGNGPAFWLFSTRHATNPAFPSINPFCAQNGLPSAQCFASELDVQEGFGTIQYGGSRTDDFFSGTLHRNTAGFYGTANQFRTVQRGTGLDMSQYHVYAVRWTASTIYYYIDGNLQGSVATFDSTNQPMHLLFYNWTTDWESENVPNASTQPELDVFVDWVRVWQQ